MPGPLPLPQSTMKTLHDQFAKEWGDLAEDFPLEFNSGEYPHPETLVYRIEEGDADQNVEVIYHTAGDVVLVQENGNDGKGRTGFVWLSDENWVEKVKSLVLEFMASI